MEKTSEIAERIKSLRGDATQTQFAEHLGVSQTTVSAWEVGDTTPSSELWVRLASLARYPDNLWFLEQAGLDLEWMVSVAERILRERSIPADPGEVKRISRFRLTPEGNREPGPPVLVAAEYVPNPGSTFAVVVDEKGAGFAFSPGDIVVVDSSAGDVETCESFWNQVVLAEFAPRAEQPAGLQGVWPEGFLVGKLVLERHGGWHPKGIVFSGRLGPLVEAFDARSFPIGHYYHEVPADLDRFGYSPPSDREMSGRLEKEGREQALKNFRPAKGCRILGRVIAWFPAPPEKK